MRIGGISKGILALVAGFGLVSGSVAARAQDAVRLQMGGEAGDWLEYTHRKEIRVELPPDLGGTAVTLTYPVSSNDGFMDPRFNLDFNPPLQGDDNTAITITLPAGGAAIAGKLNAITR